MKRMIFIFLDGVGIGKADDTNPLYTTKAQFLPFYEGSSGLPDGTPVKAIDPLLGVKGIPQSATGQTTLFTGQNAPALIGAHKGSYPNKIMRKIIKEQNVLKKLNRQGIRASYINAYPKHAGLFSAPNIELDDEGELHFSEKFPELFKRRISVTSTMLLANRTAPFDEHDIPAKRSLFQDYSNHYLVEKGLHLPEYSPETAGEILFSVSREYDFILYEYFQTDIFAHRRSLEEISELIKNLDRLIGSLISHLEREQDTLLITSDHGNIENHTHRSHTLNPVPLLAWGKEAGLLRNRIESLQDVTPAVVEFFLSEKLPR
jgi:hypothetical protein